MHLEGASASYPRFIDEEAEAQKRSIEKYSQQVLSCSWAKHLRACSDLILPNGLGGKYN